MTPDKEHSAPFTASDIQRYHSGHMSPQEMHLLEKAALDDPFLADALEGYALTPTPVQDMVEIRERLKQRTETRRTVPLFSRHPWLRAAAIIIFTVGAGLLAWQLSFSPKGKIAIQPSVQQKEQQSNSDTETKAPGTDSSTMNQPAVTEQDARVTSTDNNREISPVTPANPLPVTRSQSPSVPVQSSPAESRPRADQEDMAALKKDANKAEIGRNQYEPSYRQRNARQNEGGPSQQPINYYNGRVVDNQSNAIPFATISNSRDRNTVVTDKDGNFTLKSSDSTLDATVSAPGYEVNRLQLENSRSNTVIMKENNAALEEVVVTSAYGNQKKKEIMQTRKVVDTLEPAEGWAYFDDYIARSLQVRTDEQLETVSGEVKLSFEVNRNGEPVNIRVEKSLCPRCDEEAIRLLKEGPKWKKKKNKKGKVTIRF
jgi:hypothetical protein